MTLSIALIPCVDESGQDVPDECSACGYQKCCRQAYLIGTDPCPDLEGIWVQKVTRDASCDDCPADEPLPSPSSMTFFEQVLNDPTVINRWTQCDCFISPSCGVGTRGVVSRTAVLRYFCLDDFPNSKNPFDGAPTGNIPIPQSFTNCPCVSSHGVSSGTFPHRVYASVPTWWANYRATRTRTATASWNCCGVDPSLWTRSCTCTA